MQTTPTPMYQALIAEHHEFDPARLLDLSTAAVVKRANEANARQRQADRKRGAEITRRLAARA